MPSRISTRLSRCTSARRCERPFPAAIVRAVNGRSAGQGGNGWDDFACSLARGSRIGVRRHTGHRAGAALRPCGGADFGRSACRRPRPDGDRHRGGAMGLCGDGSARSVRTRPLRSISRQDLAGGASGLHRGRHPAARREQLCAGSRGRRFEQLARNHAGDALPRCRGTIGGPQSFGLGSEPRAAADRRDRAYRR